MNLEEQEKWRKRRQDLREEIFAIGETLKKRAETMMAYRLAKVKRETAKDGGQVVTIRPYRWNGNTVLHTYRLGVELAMLASGLSPGTHPLDEIDFQTISDADLDALLKTDKE